MAGIQKKKVKRSVARELSMSRDVQQYDHSITDTDGDTLCWDSAAR